MMDGDMEGGIGGSGAGGEVPGRCHRQPYRQIGGPGGLSFLAIGFSGPIDLPGPNDYSMLRSPSLS